MQGNGANDVSAAVTSSTEHLAAQQNAVPAVANAPAAAAQNQPMVMNAAGGQAMDDDDDFNRDWLDIVYIATRFSLMMAIVYFYSTPGRFFVVAFFSIFIYLYQAGYFRLDAYRRRRHEARAEAHAREQQQQQQQQEGEVIRCLSRILLHLNEYKAKSCL